MNNLVTTALEITGLEAFRESVEATLASLRAPETAILGETATVSPIAHIKKRVRTATGIRSNTEQIRDKQHSNMLRRKMAKFKRTVPRSGTFHQKIKSLRIAGPGNSVVKNLLHNQSNKP